MSNGPPRMNRRMFVSLTLAAPLLAAPALAEEPQITVFKSPTCGCCGAWAKKMSEAGFNVEARDVTQQALDAIKAKAGITSDLRSCHTAIVDGYVIEGHVPAEDIRQLLAARPEAVGLSVPGMPVGSPGMEMGDEREPYATLLVRRGGAAEVFARHN